VPSDGGAEGCRSCFGRELKSTGALWVKDLSVTLRRERPEGRWRVMMLEERLGCGDKKVVLIEELCRL